VLLTFYSSERSVISVLDNSFNIPKRKSREYDTTVSFQLQYNGCVTDRDVSNKVKRPGK
jgi:hypothetical protein